MIFGSALCIWWCKDFYNDRPARTSGDFDATQPEVIKVLSALFYVNSRKIYNELKHRMFRHKAAWLLREMSGILFPGGISLLEIYHDTPCTDDWLSRFIVDIIGSEQQQSQTQVAAQGYSVIIG